MDLRYLEDRWDDRVARDLDGPEILRYRSNLLGSDLRITNFGGGNTSAKLTAADPVRELAISRAPKIRVNGFSPATVIAGSTMFPRHRVVASLAKYSDPFDDGASDDDLRALLAGFYARRTLTHESVLPEDCARAVLFLAGPQARCTTGHLVPVDGGLTDAFLR